MRIITSILCAAVLTAAEKPETPPLPPDLQSVYELALAAPAEFASDALLRLAASPALSSRALKRRLIEQAFQLGSRAHEPYPLAAWKGQFDRVRADLEDALRREAELAPDLRNGDQQQYFSTEFAQMWITVDRMFELARAGNETAVRGLIVNSLQVQQAAVSNTTARLLVQNNEAQEAATARIEAIYSQVERNIYLFLIAVLVLIAATGTYLAYSNRQVFARLEPIFKTLAPPNGYARMGQAGARYGGLVQAAGNRRVFGDGIGIV